MPVSSKKLLVTVAVVAACCWYFWPECTERGVETRMTCYPGNRSIVTCKDYEVDVCKAWRW